MEIHHGKHHAAYVTNLNKALEQAPDLQNKPVHELLKNNLAIVPDSDQDRRPQQRRRASSTTRCSGQIIGPKKPAASPSATSPTAIDSTFGSFDKFKEQFAAAATSRFGSGWAWLVKNGDKLEIISTANQDSPLMEGKYPGHRPGRVGARLLPEVSEPPARIHRRLVERGELGTKRKTGSIAALSNAGFTSRRLVGSHGARRAREVALEGTAIGGRYVAPQVAI